MIKQVKNILPEKHSNSQSPQRKAGISFPAPKPFSENETIQRAISISRHANDDDKETAEKYESDLDDSTDKAYNHVLNAPDLENYKMIDGYIRNWNNTFKKAKENGVMPKMFPANFGYAVESLATKIYYPDEPAGYSAFLQVAEPGTRPDVELVKNNKAVAWLDITASNSKSHIDTKNGDWSKIPHVSEIIYSSVTSDDFEQMLENKENKEPEGVDPEKQKFLKEAAKRLALMRELRINQLKKRFTRIANTCIKNAKLLDPDEANVLLYYQAPLLSKLNSFFKLGLTIPEYVENEVWTDYHYKEKETKAENDLGNLAPHILIALGLNREKFGFSGGGEITGRNWLYRHDPGMPKMADAISALEKELTPVSESDSDEESKKRKLQDEDKINDPENTKKNRIELNID